MHCRRPVHLDPGGQETRRTRPSPKSPPKPHPSQAQRDAHDAGLAAPHPKDRPALEYGGALPLELRHAREVAVPGQSEEGAASWREPSC